MVDCEVEERLGNATVRFYVEMALVVVRGEWKSDV
jgi:hypothetical protein